MKTLFFLSVLCLSLAFKLAAVEVVNTLPRVQVVKGEVATLNAQYGGGDTANVTFEAVDANGEFVGEVVHDESSQMLIWRFDTSGVELGEYLVELLTIDSGVVSDRNRFILAVVDALPLASQIIAFAQPPTQRVGVPWVLSGAASSGLPVSFAVVSGAAVLTDKTLEFTGKGSVTVRATQEGDEVYAAAEPVEWTFEVQGIPQVVSFALATAARATEVIPLVARSTADLPVTLEVESGPGQIEEGQLSFTGTGTVVVKASQAGDTRYQAAPTVTRAIEVGLQTQVLTFGLPLRLMRTETHELIASSTSELTVALTVVSGPGVIEGSVLAFTGTGKVTVQATQAGNSLYAEAPAVQRTVTVTNPKPVLKPIALPPAMVSLWVNETISETTNATRFSAVRYQARGLPPGVQLNAITGVLSGKPTAARIVKGEVRPYTVTFTASDAGGVSDPVVVNWLIHPLPPKVLGGFNGLVESSSELSFDATQKLSGLGGRITLTSTRTGSFTGSLHLETKVHRFRGQLDSLESGDASAVVTINRGRNLPRLDLAFNIDHETAELTGTLSDGLIEESVRLRAWRNGWQMKANPAVAYVGAYNAALEVPEALQGDADYPQGNGFGRMTVTAAGLANWAGRMADGTPVTISTTLGPDGQLGLFLRLYTMVNTTAGSVLGWSKITVAESGNELDGVLAWKKQGQAVTRRNYQQGFPSHELTVVGGIYTAPAATQIVLGLPNEAGNAKLRFADGGLQAAALTEGSGGVLTQVFRIQSNNRVLMPTGEVDNPGGVSLRLNATTGAISGRFTLRDADPTDLTPPMAVLTRAGIYSGMVVPRMNHAVGYFMLPQLPTLDGQRTLRTTPELSGQVVLEGEH
jgi:hypothetical protein